MRTLFCEAIFLTKGVRFLCTSEKERGDILRKTIEQVATGYYAKFPLLFFGDNGYKDLSWQAKALYTFLSNREQLSLKNGWFHNGKVYVICTIETIMEEMNCSKGTAIKLKKELCDFNLIEEFSPGANRANYIFVHNLSVQSLDTSVQSLDTSVQSLDTSVQSLDPIKNNIKRINNKEIYIKEDGQQQTSINTIYSIAEAEQEFGRLLSPSEIELISKWLSQSDYAYSQDLVKKAIELTRLAGKTNLKYTGGILRNWRNNNITTVEQVEVEEKAKAKKKEEATEYDDIF